GDTVLKGDLLIEGKRSVGVDEKGEEIYEECLAAGSVTARVWISSRISRADKYTTFVRTGNSVTYRYIDFFGAKIGKVPPSPYACYDTSFQVINSYSLLPYNVIRVTFYETSSQIKEVGEGELDAYIFEESRRLRESIGDEARILNSRNFVKKLDNLYIMDIYYEVEKNIAVGV
ncbi:MAG: sporulation protein YqfD, partial [Clostridia bacterium]|nr:sporulation protein YqfD [Clostridia bacterium]